MAPAVTPKEFLEEHPAGGQLSALSPASVVADSGPVTVAIDPTGRYV